MEQEVVDEEQESARRNVSFREKCGPQNRSAFQEKSSRNLVLLKVSVLTLPGDPMSWPLVSGKAGVFRSARSGKKFSPKPDSFEGQRYDCPWRTCEPAGFGKTQEMVYITSFG